MNINKTIGLLGPESYKIYTTEYQRIVIFFIKTSLSYYSYIVLLYVKHIKYVAEFLSRKIFILKRINFRAELFERKFDTNFRAFWTFFARMREN